MPTVPANIVSFTTQDCLYSINTWTLNTVHTKTVHHSCHQCTGRHCTLYRPTIYTLHTNTAHCIGQQSTLYIPSLYTVQADSVHCTYHHCTLYRPTIYHHCTLYTCTVEWRIWDMASAEELDMATRRFPIHRPARTHFKAYTGSHSTKNQTSHEHCTVYTAHSIHCTQHTLHSIYCTQHTFCECESRYLWPTESVLLEPRNFLGNLKVVKIKKKIKKKKNCIEVTCQPNCNSPHPRRKPWLTWSLPWWGTWLITWGTTCYMLSVDRYGPTLVTQVTQVTVVTEVNVVTVVTGEQPAPYNL